MPAGGRQQAGCERARCVTLARQPITKSSRNNVIDLVWRLIQRGFNNPSRPWIEETVRPSVGWSYQTTSKEKRTAEDVSYHRLHHGPGPRPLRAGPHRTPGHG